MAHNKWILIVVLLSVLFNMGCEQPTSSTTDYLVNQKAQKQYTTVYDSRDNVPKPYNDYKFMFIVNESGVILGDSAYYYYNTELDGWVIDVYQGECKGCGETIFLKDIQTIKIK